MELFQTFVVKIRQRIRAVCMEPPGKLSQKLVDGVQTPNLFCVQASELNPKCDSNLQNRSSLATAPVGL